MELLTNEFTRSRRLDAGASRLRQSLRADVRKLGGSPGFAKVLANESSDLEDGSNAQNGYAATNGYSPENEPIVVALPGTETVDPNRW